MSRHLTSDEMKAFADELQRTVRTALRVVLELRRPPDVTCPHCLAMGRVNGLVQELAYAVALTVESQHGHTPAEREAELESFLAYLQQAIATYRVELRPTGPVVH